MITATGCDLQTDVSHTAEEIEAWMRSESGCLMTTHTIVSLYRVNDDH